MGALVSVERRGGAHWVTLDRPPPNLIVPELIAELRAVFEALGGDPAVRVAVVTGRGRAMTAGMQLQVLRDLTPASAKALIAALHGALHAVHEAPFPTVAMVNGACLGAGFELLLTGSPVGARRALEWGLVNRVAPRAELERVTEALIAPVLAAAPGAIRLQKELIVRWRNTDERSAVDFGINAFAQAYATGEPREAVQAYLEKRPPRF